MTLTEFLDHFTVAVDKSFIDLALYCQHIHLEYDIWYYMMQAPYGSNYGRTQLLLTDKQFPSSLYKLCVTSDSVAQWEFI